MFNTGRAIVMGLALMAVGCVLLMQESVHLRLRSYALAAVAPALKAGSRLRNELGGVDRNFRTLEACQKELRRLRDENHELVTDNQSFLSMARENDVLRKKLGFRQSEAFAPIACRVIGRDPSNWWDSLIVALPEDVSSETWKSDSRSAWPVVSPQGVVGKTGTISKGALEVVLLVNENCRITAMLESSKQHGILIGDGAIRGGDPLTRLTYIPRKSEVAVGEKVFTSGLDGIFPAGLFLGVVEEVAEAGDADALYREVVVRPAFTLSHLGEIFVVRGER